jgi:hypothetical protein
MNTWPSIPLVGEGVVAVWQAASTRQAASKKREIGRVCFISLSDV